MSYNCNLSHSLIICAPPGSIWVGMAEVLGWDVDVGTALRADTDMGCDPHPRDDVKLCSDDGESTCTCRRNHVVKLCVKSSLDNGLEKLVYQKVLKISLQQ